MIHAVEQPQTTQLELLRPSTNFAIRQMRLQIAPNIPNFLETAVENPAARQKMETIKKNFEDADTVVFIAGTFGLGDAVIRARYCLELLQKTNKTIICQVNNPLIPTFTHGLENDRLRFVSQVPQEVINDDKVFYIEPVDFLMAKHDQWVEDYEQSKELIDETLIEIMTQKRFFDHETLFIGLPGEMKATIRARLGLLNSGHSTYDQDIALMLQLLGVEVSVKDLRENSLVTFTEEEVLNTPQDLDFLVVPDAKEYQHITEDRSQKSLPVESWKKIFEDLPKGSKLGIVIGVSHPEYCKQVIQAAKEAGLEVEVIESDLLGFCKTVLRAKTFIGMDSGTTHLAVEVKRAARRFGREITIREFFNQKVQEENVEGVSIESYGITEGLICLVSYLGRFDRMTDDDRRLAHQFITS